MDNKRFELVGLNMRIKFQNECVQSCEKFLTKQMRRPVKNFSQEQGKTTVGRLNVQKMAAESLRDAFIRLAVMITDENNIDLESIMAYPITEYPLSIAHADGSMMKTNKADLQKKLEEYQKYLTPAELPTISATIIDGGLLLHSILSNILRMTTFGELARTLLSQISKHKGDSIHVLFDKTET